MTTAMNTATGKTQREVKQSLLVSLQAFLSLVYALTVRDLRVQQRNAALGILFAIATPIVTCLVFYVIIRLLKQSSATPIRGDDLTYLLSGFMVFFLHTATVGGVAGAIMPSMMPHQRATPFLFVCVKAFASLYTHMAAFAVILLFNYLIRGVWEMDHALLAIFTVLTAWLYGIGLGMILLALQRYVSWANLVKIAYMRIMFFTSGKFFVGNTAPMREMYDWNPLFHIIDQMRSAVFLNYTAKTTSLSYAWTWVFIVLVLGFLCESYVRRNYSMSHFPGQN